MEKIIELHESAEEILYNIKYFRTQRDTRRSNILGFFRDFPPLIKKAKHDIEIFEKCEERLWERYAKAMAEVQRLKTELNSQQ